MKNLRPLSLWEWLFCSLGMFFMGFGIAYIGLVSLKQGLAFFVAGLILEIPAFYLVYKHK